MPHKISVIVCGMNSGVEDTITNQQKERKYMPSLDGLRGLACLMVVFSHACRIDGLGLEGFAGPVSYIIGCLGVILFFALSGFLMSTLYLDRVFSMDNAIRFTAARAARIAPAYYAAVTFVLLLTLTVLPDYMPEMDGVMAIRSYLFVGSAGFFWSIPPEVQFYGFFLLIWGAFYLFKGGRRSCLYAVLFVCAAMIATRDHWGGILLPSKLHIFLAGVLAAYLLRYARMGVLFSRTPVQIFAVFAAIAYGVWFSASLLTWRMADLLAANPLYSDIPLSIVIAAGIMALSHSTSFTKVLEMRGMRLLGSASFSIYLFHEPLLRLMEGRLILPEQMLAVNAALAVIVAVGAPVLFYLFCEKTMNEKARMACLSAIFNVRERFLSRKKAA
ncbi:MAG: hypothetical protein DI626_05905 [Micavibrio aeruginosavorus]|uniref:Acyltransferase 3 domain-containing protein n=1 Tax=Micavibrio aeruginosavorus TaxID=349221 RepID=A0A2W5A0C5_9BACT|nr:MAG: hypothetical protein DI626_05905 [Micavibrio aeruginosavorus]